MPEIAEGAIACVGWGSLIWDPRDLPMHGTWQDDRPLLPVEFARESGEKAKRRGDKVTLVICPDYPRARTCWTLLDVPDLTTARKRLARREGIAKRWETDIGYLDYGGKATKPTGEQVVAFLRNLDDDKRLLAEAYVRQAPAAIDAPYRRMIAEQLGWHHRS